MALRYLGRREYAGQELVRKLQQRGVESDTAEVVLEELQQLGLQSDSRFAESFSRQRVMAGYGPARIRSELRHRGVNDTLVSEALAPFEDDWYELARDWVRRKVRGELDEKTRARIYRGGMNRGFSHDQIMRAIDAMRRGDD